MSGITLDQFKVFVAIVDQGGFAAAARELSRTQSAITYTMRKLEEQTGLALFDRTHYRPALTDAGQSLLPHARKVLDDVSDYRLHAEGIAQGVEPSLVIAVTQYAPYEPLVALLKRFHEQFPTVRLRVLTLTLQSTEPLDKGRADLALLPEFVPMNSDYRRHHCTISPLVAVAGPEHPLSQMPAPIPLEAMRMHTQIVTSGRKAPMSPRNYAVQALNDWHVDDLDVKRRMIVGGMGWGGLPHYLAEDDIAAGRLVALEPIEWDGLDHLPELDIVVTHRQDRPLGPAGTWLFDHLVDAF